jgi:hypothetical protein
MFLWINVIKSQEARETVAGVRETQLPFHKGQRCKRRNLIYSSLDFNVSLAVGLSAYWKLSPVWEKRSQTGPEHLMMAVLIIHRPSYMV